MALTALNRFDKEDLNPGEIIIYRAHLNFVAFLVNGRGSILLILLALIVLGLAWWYRMSIGFLIDGTITFSVFLISGGIFLYGGYYFSRHLIDWLYDEDIITNQRVVDYDQSFLFSQDLRTASMKSVENIYLNQSGILRTFFNYGNLDVQTSSSGRASGPGESGKYLVLHDVSRPKQVQRLIDEIINRVKLGVEVDPDEVLLICGLREGNLEDYFLVKKTSGWREKVRKLLGKDF